MKRLVATAAIASVLGGCSKSPSPTTTEVTMYRAAVGAKTPLFEVVAPNELRLEPGVRFQVVEGPGGTNSGIVLFRANGDIGA
jgi:ABC-type glycerol-3-phosphate transport system substrate-binding protein